MSWPETVYATVVVYVDDRFICFEVFLDEAWLYEDGDAVWIVPGTVGTLAPSYRNFRSVPSR